MFSIFITAKEKYCPTYYTLFNLYFLKDYVHRIHSVH